MNTGIGDRREGAVTPIHRRTDETCGDTGDRRTEVCRDRIVGDS
jgi:hypothetical protein